MRKMDGTPKQQGILAFSVVLAIAAAFPLAYPAKNCTTLLYYWTSIVALALALTRLRTLALPTLLSLCALVVSFLIPLDITLVKNKPFGAAWVRYEAVDPWDYSRARLMAGTNYVTERDRPQVNGVGPLWILRVYVPWGTPSRHGANQRPSVDAGAALGFAIESPCPGTTEAGCYPCSPVVGRPSCPISAF